MKTTSLSPGNRITAPIERKWLAEIVSGRKRIEKRDLGRGWRKRLSRVQVPFQLRLINGMHPKAPEATVLIRKVTTSIKDGQYRLHIGRVLSVRFWDRVREQRSPVSIRAIRAVVAERKRRRHLGAAA